MTAAVPMFLAGASDRLADLALNCLAVAGGYLAGHVLGGLVAWALDRYAFARKSPDFVKQMARVVCGVALAILVALIVFGKGGGTGGGKGDGEGKGSGDAPGKADARAPDDPRPPAKVDVPKLPDVDPTTPAVHVTVLAGPAAEGDKLYWFEADRTKLTLDEVKAKVSKKKAEAGGKGLRLIVVYPIDLNHQPPDNHPTVTKLTHWADGQKIPWEPRRDGDR